LGAYAPKQIRCFGPLGAYAPKSVANSLTVSTYNPKFNSFYKEPSVK